MAVTSTRFKYYTGLKVRAKKHFYGRAAAVMSFSEAFFALLRYRLSTQFYEVIVVLTTCASDERVYGPSARLPDEPAHIGCRMLAHLREAACPGALGSPHGTACAASRPAVRVLVSY